MPKGENILSLKLMQKIDMHFLEHPYYMTDYLNRKA